MRALVQAAIEAVTAEDTDPEVEPEVEPEAEPEAEEQTPVGAEASEEKRASPFAAVADHIEENGEAWREWYDLEAPEQTPFPGGFSETLNVFEQMLLLRCVRVDRVTVAITRSSSRR